MNPIEQLNKIFDSRVRLGIMSVLIINEEVSYNELKEVLELTDGNLASHSKALEDAGYIKVQKSFVGRKPRTTYSITKVGDKAFRAHLTGLEKLLGN
jgi:DNA-binding MarR family transcriptional regulator